MSEQLLTTVAPCQIHGVHNPASHINHVHHIWPLGDDGPDVAANRIVVCATGHENIHNLLRLLRKQKGVLDPLQRKGYARTEINLALLGWKRLTTQSMVT